MTKRFQMVIPSSENRFTFSKWTPNVERENGKSALEGQQPGETKTTNEWTDEREKMEMGEN